MPSINLIAARRAEKVKSEKLTHLMLIVIFSEAIIALGLFSFMTASAYSAVHKISSLDSQLKKIQPTVDKIHYYERETKELKPRLELLASSNEQTLLWRTILQNLSLSMPEKTWLQSLSTSQTAPSSSGGGIPPPPQTMLSLNGSTISQKLVGETMLRLNQFPEFEKVELVYTQDENDQTKKGVNFQMSVLVKSNKQQKGGSS